MTNVGAYQVSSQFRQGLARKWFSRIALSGFAFALPLTTAAEEGPTESSALETLEVCLDREQSFAFRCADLVDLGWQPRCLIAGRKAQLPLRCMSANAEKTKKEYEHVSDRFYGIRKIGSDTQLLAMELDPNNQKSAIVCSLSSSSMIHFVTIAIKFGGQQHVGTGLHALEWPSAQLVHRQHALNLTHPKTPKGTIKTHVNVPVEGK